MTIADVRDQLTDILNGEGGGSGVTVTYYAMLFKSYVISYYDENEISLGQESVVFRADDTASTHGYTVNMAYTVQSNEFNFEGWLVNQGSSNIVGYVENKAYQNGEEIDISGDIKFGVSAPAGHWLVFNENGKGAKYNAARFLKTNDVTEEPCPDEEMTRFGYTFGGWYTDAACTDGNEFEFGHTLTDFTTIYAKWIPNNEAGYTVLIWRQNLDADGYDFVEAITLTGTVGQAATGVTATGSGDNRYAIVNGVNKQYDGFHLKEYDQNVIVATEGNSVVNVYYDRTEYSLTFQVQSGWQWNTIKTITALYGQNIADNFPIVGSNGVTYNNGQRWMPQNSSLFSDVIVFLEVMPAGNVNFHVDTNTHTTRTMRYYVEALPDDPVDETFDGKNFTLYNTIYANL